MKVEVRGNPKVYKALKDQMAQILAELQRIETGQEADEELLEITKFVAEVVGGMKEEKTQFPSIADGGPRDSSASIWDTQTHKRGGR